MKRFGMLCCGLVLAFGSQAYADVLYDNTPECAPPGCTTTAPGSGNGDLTAGTTLYDSFSTPVGITEQLTSLDLILMAGPGVPMDPVSIDLYADNGLAPGVLIANLGSISDQNIAATPTRYTFDLTASPPSPLPTLSAGTRYWIGLTGGPNTTAEWVHAIDNTNTVGVDGEYWTMGTDPPTSNLIAPPYQMKVTAAPVGVPEPSSILLLALGVIVAAFTVRRNPAAAASR